MYVCQLRFNCVADVELSVAQTAISKLLDEYRYNGQIIGREFPVILVDGYFEVLFVCPEQDSVAVKYNTQQVTAAFEAVTKCGLSLPEFKLLGLESQSDFVDTCISPSPLVLYLSLIHI